MTSVSLFIIACVLLIILPGPDTAIVTKNTVIGGRKGGMQTMIGSCVGLSLHTIAAVAGLSAIIVKSAFAFTVIKYVGAVYLCYLGVRTLMNMRAKKNQVDEEVLVEAKGNSYFKQGFIKNITVYTSLANGCSKVPVNTPSTNVVAEGLYSVPSCAITLNVLPSSIFPSKVKTTSCKFSVIVAPSCGDVSLKYVCADACGTAKINRANIDNKNGFIVMRFPS